jgi:F420-0:gamma-glutamyl ligase
VGPVIDYAENEAYSLEKLKDSPEAEAEAAKTWNAVDTARAIIAKAIAA